MISYMRKTNKKWFNWTQYLLKQNLWSYILALNKNELSFCSHKNKNQKVTFILHVYYAIRGRLRHIKLVYMHARAICFLSSLYFILLCCANLAVILVCFGRFLTWFKFSALKHFFVNNKLWFVCVFLLPYLYAMRRWYESSEWRYYHYCYVLFDPNIGLSNLIKYPVYHLRSLCLLLG